MVFCFFVFMYKEVLTVYVGRREGANQERVDNFRKKKVLRGGSFWRESKGMC